MARGDRSLKNRVTRQLVRAQSSGHMPSPPLIMFSNRFSSHRSSRHRLERLALEVGPVATPGRPSECQSVIQETTYWSATGSV